MKIIIIIYIRFLFFIFFENLHRFFIFCFNNIDYKFLLHHFQIDFTFQINWRHRMTLVSYFKPLSETQWTILVVLNSLFDISKVELLWDFLIDTWYLSFGAYKRIYYQQTDWDYVYIKNSWDKASFDQNLWLEVNLVCG